MTEGGPGHRPGWVFRPGPGFHRRCRDPGHRPALGNLWLGHPFGSHRRPAPSPGRPPAPIRT